MPASRSPSDSESRSLHSEPLRERVSAAFQKLAASAAELNVASDELARPISAIEAVLQSLNPGVPAWAEFRSGSYDQGPHEFCETWHIGYAKVSQRWGLAIRYSEDVDGDLLNREEWYFNDAPRAYRLDALKGLPELIEEMAEATGRTAVKVREGVALTKQVAETIGRMAPSKLARKPARKE